MKKDGVNRNGAVRDYTMVVSNGGPSAANGSGLDRPGGRRPGEDGVSCTGAAQRGGVSGASVTLALLQGTGIVIPTLPNSGSVTFTVTGTAGDSGSIANVATVAPPVGTNDDNGGNNSSTANTTHQSTSRESGN